MTTIQNEAARAEVLARLEAFRRARATLHDDIRHAAELGISTTEIARASGLSWHGTKKIIDRDLLAEIRPEE